ncbi:MAG: DNA repair protein RecO [Candidatus Levybacteria bacterium RIFCSPHIGHO2_12_FULL_38_12]|nr:MAG: DNA repair protein RecO [Candidatus Levybacteria bacterium RIFCSPHIGHO2_01_FULL_38_12]OGH21792.1 MAG: DNA repair protein RecO [Candidatus Levybacteria bacterium RIFCSPHIGHO2_02_FULL_37_18]OGH22550.1 MAG: DNA repair protein RecO [Candidatus Levybacteria bacterium RIFCSPHIGHO2_12_FULL_38_12]OGH33413.1 MAG: DNA repair protein RecO [Candidatus Levybacteria bacterium RIFCSPLOWO2_01_FULL_37_20]OGH44088.1 MAG: DNA repair protein RecO [Candidatus Levybacteria bacterium RIFCSPLOWO2_02_FULL_37_18
MKTFTTEAIVIKRKNYNEADRILTVFAKKHGKLSIKASGVRKITSRRSAHIELLNHTLLTVYKNNGMPVLTEAQSLNTYSDIKRSLSRIGYAYHLCELVDSLCPENQENEYVYALLLDMLDKLSKEEYVSLLVKKFEIELLTALGFYSPQFAAQHFDSSLFIEDILEKRLKAIKIIPQFS